MPLNESSPRRVRRKIVDEDHAWFSGAQKIESEREGAKFLRAVDQNGVAILQVLRQNYTGVAVQKIDVLVWLQLRLGGGSVLRFSIKLHADDARFRETARQNERAFAARPS